ncbi:MAG: DEAD/DEAH box helicase [Bacteroidota bacterium]
MKNTKEAELREEITQGLAEAGFKKATPVQDKAFPILLNSTRHLVALAPKGAGKTGAYGLPILRRIETFLPMLQALILVPDRDTCTEVANELKLFAQGRNLARVLVLHEGKEIESQADELQEQVHIAVATPSRAVELINHGALELGQVVWLVLDDADQLLDRGSRRDVETVMRYVSQHRRIVISAESMPKAVDDFARKRLKKYDKINLAEKKSSRSKKNAAGENGKKNSASDNGKKNSAQDNGKAAEKRNSAKHQSRKDKNTNPEAAGSKVKEAASAKAKEATPPKPKEEPAPRPRRKLRGNGDTKIDYTFFKVPARGRFRYLLEILRRADSQRCLIFVKNSRKMRDLLRFLIQEDFAVGGMAEKMPSHQYDKVLRRFQEKEAQVLIVTDGIVADLDFEGVNLVIHYNPPEDDQGYRERHDFLSDASGPARAFLLGNNEEEARIPELEKFFKVSVPVNELTLPPKEKKPAPAPAPAAKEDNREPKRQKENKRNKPKEEAREERSKKRPNNKKEKANEGSGREKKPEGRNKDKPRSPRKDTRPDNKDRNNRRRGRSDDSRHQEPRDPGALPRRMERVYESEYVDTPDTPTRPRKLQSNDLAEVIAAVRNINPTEAGLDREWSAIYKKFEKLTWEELIRHFIAYIVQSDVVQDLDEDEEDDTEVSGIKALFRAFKRS